MKSWSRRTQPIQNWTQAHLQPDNQTTVKNMRRHQRPPPTKQRRTVCSSFYLGKKETEWKVLTRRLPSGGGVWMFLWLFRPQTVKLTENQVLFLRFTVFLSLAADALITVCVWTLRPQPRLHACCSIFTPGRVTFCRKQIVLFWKPGKYWKTNVKCLSLAFANFNRHESKVTLVYCYFIVHSAFVCETRFEACGL